MKEADEYKEGMPITCHNCGRQITNGQFFHSFHTGCYFYADKPKDHDPVNHPLHYTKGKIEVADFVEDQLFNHHLASAIEYICRADYKGNPIMDLEKAIWYLKRSIKHRTDHPELYKNKESVYLEPGKPYPATYNAKAGTLVFDGREKK